ncbi:hypothetical protein PR048_004845 [Dryococelus australis]|uniref:tRNA (cytosine(38)-C(5))-methyltransferase n=1 Tax=Dryococelus australis TaxID=614101 RepID=A0ABQ9I6L2_9NEOP|nr:hypothetical protein PR048_004845 [Dryococelus australis]
MHTTSANSVSDLAVPATSYCKNVPLSKCFFFVSECEITSTVEAAIDINTVANHVYRYNFPETKLLSRNILSLTAEEINNLHIEMILMSPPCQPFTRYMPDICQHVLFYRVGLKKDVADDRTSPLLHIIKILPYLKEPFKYLLLENVKGFEMSEARNRLVEALQNMNYTFQEFILSPSQFSIPNSRHRYYLIAKQSLLQFCFDIESLMEQLPELNRDNYAKTIGVRVCDLNSTYKGMIDHRLSTEKNNRVCFKLHHILENKHEDYVHSFLLPDKLLLKHFLLLDIVSPSSTRSCCFTKAYGHYVEGTGSVLCPVLPEDIASCTGCLEKLKKLQLRYFTDREIARLMCFPEEFRFPGNVTLKQRYRLLGNSINVHVVSLLITLLVA